jgi:hypothetical protein
MNFSNIILSALAFASIQPLYFWIPFNDSFKQKFRKFNMVLPNVIGGLLLVTVWLIDIPLSLKIIVTVWKAVLFFASRYSWKKDYPDPKHMTISCLIGIYAYIRLHAYFAISGGEITLISLFGR